MKASEQIKGRVASIHLHPAAGGQPLTSVTSINVIEEKGIEGNPRYFGRRGRNGGPSKRQVTLIEREQISEHAAALGLQTVVPGQVRSNIETEGIDLVALMGQNVQIGGAVLHFGEPRTPCQKMDAICSGLRALMENGKQGVIAQVIVSGSINVGDAIIPLGMPREAAVAAV